jgi:hypothetical protein
MVYRSTLAIKGKRGESYHPVVGEITCGQLSFEDSGKRLSIKILSICKEP